MVEFERTIERTFAAGAEPVLEVHNRRGEVTVLGEDRDDIHVHVRVQVTADDEEEAQERFEAVTPRIEQDGERVSIAPPPAQQRGRDFEVHLLGLHFGIPLDWPGSRTDITVRVPRRCAVRVDHRSGPASVTGVGAGAHVESRSGRTRVEDVEGEVRVDARSGDVRVRDVRGCVRVDVRSGRIEVESVRGDVTVEARSGNAHVRRVQGAVRVTSRAGRVRLEDSEGPIAVDSRAATVDVRGRIVHPAEIEARAGAVRLAVTRDSGFYLDAETKAGSIVSDLPVGYLEQPPEGAPTVRVRTVAGSVHIVQA